MKNILKISVLCLFATFLMSLRDPVGESARYTLDKSSSRTTRMVKSGEFTMFMAEALPDYQDGFAYRLQANYNMNIRILGKRKDTINIPLLQDVFADDFFDRLERAGSYYSRAFKAIHLGRKTAHLPNGSTFERTHHVRIYDIDLSVIKGTGLKGALFGVKGAAAELKDLEIIGHVVPGMAALGAVLVDFKGKISGVRFKAGFDMVENRMPN